MRTFVGRLVPVVAMVFAPMAAVTIATPAVSSAACANGEWWDPKANVCRPPGAPLALPCDAGQWWDPTGDVCRPLGVGAQPLGCDNGWWWDPTTNVCRPPLVAPAG
jgi:hypothetical protein